ncbi:hypothetical protein [Edaphobacillus lindanitolerans]|uniref:Uncharacterized protein n=1 Tax=Edaphobacillus lindanitolerans TaxID=550447 RepID=A0A1U7PKE0_9BACI|nr:hypothetical protein [Edaphobacillus lindanitolerans]SIT84708.1 hypothetical protein SAMN05428946_1751 [Edaphobacillus lindanitolerans]
MKLYQVRKGQFVFYQNELYKVYSINPLARKSVHMYRVKDMEQAISKAEEITYHKPQHMDSFMFYGKRYTLREDLEPEEGGFVLVTKPDPEPMSHYGLNEFEKVEQLEGKTVMTSRQNIIKRKEFMVMSEGMDGGARDISYQDPSAVTEDQLEADKRLERKLSREQEIQPNIGDIYLNLHDGSRSMVVAVVEDDVYLGHGQKFPIKELLNSDHWTLVYVNTDFVL